jgi:glucose-6-phosphate 1-epimerase
MNIPTSTPWSRPGIIDFELSPGNLTTFRIHTPLVTARFATQGAHLIDFIPTGGAPLLFVSANSHFVAGKAIRGGIPVIFPWFGPRTGHPESPMHGLVRTRPWEISAIEVRPDHSVRVEFRFASSPETMELWPYAFELKLEFVLGTDLHVRWEVKNSGPESFRFEQALHPYFPIHDVFQTSVHGLKGAEYIDKTDGLSVKQESAEWVSFGAETDRLYLDTSATCILEDKSAGRRLVITKEGSQSSVVWNPWIAKAAALSDLRDEEWKEFVCVEQVNADRNSLELNPGGTHVFTVRYSPQSVAI